MTRFADRAPDVAALAKNAGPQSLRIDYLAPGGRLAFYTPDFFIRTKDNTHFLVETKGRVDSDVPRKAHAAIAWCQAASTQGIKWEYLYVPQGAFEKLTGETVAVLARTCAPALQNLLAEEDDKTRFPLLALITPKDEAPDITAFVDAATLQKLPPRYAKAVEQAVMLFRFFENKEGMNYAPVFNALLGSIDEACKGVIVRRLKPSVPVAVNDQKTWFAPYLGNVDHRMEKHYSTTAQNLKRTLIFNNGISPLGLLRTCLDFALNDNAKLGGVFDAVRNAFKQKGGRDFLALVESINDFRNTRVAHQEQDFNDSKEAKRQLLAWINALATFTQTA
jgi:type III restriction enzyme